MKPLRLLLLACLGAASLVATAQKRYAGGDLSLLPCYEDAGAAYADHDGTPIDQPLDFFARQGFNAVRVRLFVDPSNAPTAAQGQGVRQDFDFVCRLAKRVKAAGLALLLDFHYSDTWADPSNQWTPNAWLGLNDAELANRLHDYTLDVLQRLSAAGAKPDLIQTGNEISYGMLWGKQSEGNANAVYNFWPTTDNARRFAKLLQSATTACREACPEAQIILHTERVESLEELSSFCTLAAFHDIDFDVIGLSYYPAYHGKLSDLDAAIGLLETECPDKDVMVVETGYPYRWPLPDTRYDYTATYPYSEAGQLAFTQDLINLLKRHDKVTGLFWWWPEANECGLDWNTQRVTDTWYNAALFDNETGRATLALAAIGAFADSNNETGLTSPLQQSGAKQRLYSVSGQPAADLHKQGIYVGKNRKVLIP